MTVSGEQKVVSSKRTEAKRMTRKSFVFTCLLPTVLLLTGLHAQAQQTKKIPRIGYLTVSSLAANVARIEAFRQGLRELGYVEGNNIVIE
jgi:putative tryptophan/tyrosine transport system substrate-binding protein